MELDEEITIREYDSEWPLWYIEETSALYSIFGQEVYIEHFGSTSIPGLVAKPVVDILIGITDFPNIAKLHLKGLETLGYECLGSAGIPERISFRKRGQRSFNLAVTQYRSALWDNNIMIRDYLRHNPDEAQHYAEHKIDVFQKGFRTLLAYSEQKSDFITNLLTRAKTRKRNH